MKSLLYKALQYCAVFATLFCLSSNIYAEPSHHHAHSHQHKHTQHPSKESTAKISSHPIAHSHHTHSPHAAHHPTKKTRFHPRVHAVAAQSTQEDNESIRIDGAASSSASGPIESNLNLPVPTAFQDNEINSESSFANTSNSDTVDENSAPETTHEKLVGLIHRAISVLHHTSYRMGGSYFDLSRGIYEEDCSGYVDQLLNRAEPDAYASLTQWTHSSKPSSFDYYDFFKKLPDSNWHFWQKIKDVARLKPGAILVFRYHGRSRLHSGGHVMVVMSQPVPVENQSDTFLVKVSDSAYSGHSNDTRATHTSGVGIGTLLLKVNPFTREPNAFSWKLTGWLEHADVAMAEPVTPA